MTLVWIVLVGAVLRGILIMSFAPENQVSIIDERDYNWLAIQIVENQQFAFRKNLPCSARPPLFPAMMAVVYAIAGIENFQAVRVCQAVLGLVLVIQVYVFSLRLFNRQAALWAAALTSFYPTFLGFTLFLLSEILFSVLLLAGLLTMQSHWRSQAYWKLALAGFSLGLATLTRSVLWPFWPLLAIYVCFSERANWPKRIAAGAIVSCAFVLTLAPWTYRNFQLEKTLVVVDTLGGRNLMMGNYEHTLEYRAWDTITVVGKKSWDVVLESETPNYQQLTQGERDKLAMRRGLNYIFLNQGTFWKRSLIKFFNFWQLPRTIVGGMADGRWGQFSPASLWSVASVIFVSYLIALVSGIYGFLLLPPDDRRMHWFLLLLVVFVCAVHTVVFAHSRYHLSLMPLIFAYSGQAMIHRSEIWSRINSKCGWLASGICFFLAMSWLWQMAIVDGDRIQQWMS